METSGECQMKRLILTGATGMIGSAIVSCALSLGYEVLCLVRKDSPRLGNIPRDKNVSLLSANLSDLAAVELHGRYDTFIHLGWDKTYGNSRDNVDTQLDNIRYTLDAVRLAKKAGCSVFVGAGSQAEYGPVANPLAPDTPTNPESGYGIAKLSAGLFARLLCKQIGLRFNWIRILSVYGVKDAPHTLIKYVISELLAGRSPELTPCNQVWDYCDARDVARAFMAVSERGLDGKFYVLGSGIGHPLHEYLTKIQNIINPSIPLGFGEKPYFPHQPMYLVADISALDEDVGWRPSIRFEDGIRDVVAHMTRNDCDAIVAYGGNNG